MTLQAGPWRDATDWIVALDELFGLRVPRSEIAAALGRAIDHEKLNHDRLANTYVLRDDTRADIEMRFQIAADGERAAQASWLSELDVSLLELGSDSLWRCLLGYAGRVFRRFGNDAIDLLQTGSSQGGLDAQSMADALRDAIEEVDLPLEMESLIGAEIARFFDGSAAERSQFATELISSTFNFMTLGVDESTRKLLREGLPKITIFVDTNALYSLLGAHSSALATATHEVFGILHSLNVTLYCHEKTVTELENTLEAVGDHLRARQWTQAMSRALLAAVPTSMTSIETRFHEINSETPTTPAIFLQRYRNPLPILEQFGVSIYREAVANPASMERRATLTVEYMEWLKENAPRRRRGNIRYEAADHDMRLWLATRARQIPGSRGTMFCGAMLLTADSALRRYDRTVLTPDEGGSAPVVVSPDALLQALSPFASATVDISDSAFARLFAATEFRGMGSDYGRTIKDITAHLATFADLPEETAIRLLTDAILISRLKDYSRDSEEFADLINDAIVAENEALLEERNAARDAQVATQNRVSEASQEVESRLEYLRSVVDAGANTETLRGLIEDIEDRVSRLGTIPNQFAVINMYNGGELRMTGHGGDQFLNVDSNVGAQGSGASARQFTQGDASPMAIGDLADLGRELSRLRAEAASTASSSADFEVVTEIARAQEAAERGDEEATTSHLRKAGKRGLDVAQALGVGLAVAAIRHAIGM